MERTTACELSGLPNTIRWFTHLADPRSDTDRQGRGRGESVLEALLDNQALCAQTGADDHPSFVVEVAEDHLETLPNFSESVCHRRTSLLECDICSPGRRRVRGLDRFRLNVVGSGDQNDNISILAVGMLVKPCVIAMQDTGPLTYLTPAPDSEVVCEHAVCDPSDIVVNS